MRHESGRLLISVNWVFCVAVLASAAVFGGDVRPAPREVEAETVRIPVTRDTWFSNYPTEVECNTGGSSRLKLKSIQEMSLVDFDPAPLEGRVIRSAKLHVRVAGDEILRRVTVGTFASGWIEGTARSYAPEEGSSSFRWQRNCNLPWTPAASDVPGGGDLCHVMLGQGGTFWCSADATQPDAERWQTIAVDPKVIGACVAGVSRGLLLFDDTGSEWTRDGEDFHLRLFPNRYIYSKDQNAASAPYLTIELTDALDVEPPKPIVEIEAFTTDPQTGEALPPGEAILRWKTPEDVGSAGVVGFHVEAGSSEIPRYLIPAAGKPAERVEMHLRDLGRSPGETIRVEVAAVDAAGNVGHGVSATVKSSDYVSPALDWSAPRLLESGGALPRLNGYEVCVVDALDKVHPVTGAMIPTQDQAYRSGNHLFSAKDRRIRLAAARGEFIGFQIVLHGEAEDVHAELTVDGGTWRGATEPSSGPPDYEHGIDIRFSRFRHVKAGGGPLPDPVLPLEGPMSIPMADDPVPNQQYAAMLCEIYVSNDQRLKPGSHRGVLTLTSADEQLELAVELWVWDFDLPDELGFLPEMNCYGLPDNERAYYRLAHQHRTVLNRLPYSQNGSVATGCAPARDGDRLDWSAWDARFGPLLSGSAFADLPRRGVPIELFYLPLHENWPSPMEGNYSGDYWADRAFPPAYREAFVDMSRRFAEHFAERGYDRTLFQCYLNNKNNFKQRGWSRGSSPWLLDEPANFQDYWALRYFGEAFHEGVAAAADRGTAAGRPQMLYRCDISRPQWQRETLDQVLDYNVVGSSTFKKYHRMVMDRKRRFGQVVIPYGTTNAVEDSNMQPVGWCLDAWLHGGDGVLPWQTIGRGESWEKADQLALFYPGASIGRDDVIPSIRLKAYRRGQQDVEYLARLAEHLGQAGRRVPRWAVAEAVRELLALHAQHVGTGFSGEDAGVTRFAALRPQDAWALRIQVARQLSRMSQTAKRQ